MLQKENKNPYFPLGGFSDDVLMSVSQLCRLCQTGRGATFFIDQ